MIQIGVMRAVNKKRIREMKAIPSTTIDHPFTTGVKVAIVKREPSWCDPNVRAGEITRSTVTSVVTKGRLAGRFTVDGQDGQWEAYKNPVDGAWRGCLYGSYPRGYLILDDENAAKIEDEFAEVTRRRTLIDLERDIASKTSSIVRKCATREEQERATSILQRALDVLSE